MTLGGVAGSLWFNSQDSLLFWACSQAITYSCPVLHLDVLQPSRSRHRSSSARSRSRASNSTLQAQVRTVPAASILPPHGSSKYLQLRLCGMQPWLLHNTCRCKATCDHRQHHVLWPVCASTLGTTDSDVAVVDLSHCAGLFGVAQQPPWAIKGSDHTSSSNHSNNCASAGASAAGGPTPFPGAGAFVFGAHPAAAPAAAHHHIAEAEMET